MPKTKTPKGVIRSIISLRKKGRSINEIIELCNVSQGTVSFYIRGIAILPKYQQRWLDRRNASKIISERSWKQAELNAARFLGNLTEKELALLGIALYWAEGSKKDFGLSNTDPDLIKSFLYILRNVFRIPDSKIKVSIRIYEDLDRKACLRHWSKVTGIKLGKDTSINVLIGSKKGKLKYGMCKIRVLKGGLLLKEFFSIIKGVVGLLPPS